MKTKNYILFFLLFLLMFILLYTPITKAIAQGDNFCSKRDGSMWATTLQGAWMSTHPTGDWKKDDWFYKLKSYERVVILERDYGVGTGYFLVCYDFNSSFGWEPLVGWVQKENILLDSDVIPAP